MFAERRHCFLVRPGRWYTIESANITAYVNRRALNYGSGPTPLCGQPVLNIRMTRLIPPIRDTDSIAKCHVKSSRKKQSVVVAAGDAVHGQQYAKREAPSRARRTRHISYGNCSLSVNAHDQRTLGNGVTANCQHLGLRVHTVNPHT